MSVLTKIIDKKRDRIQEAKARRTIAEVKAMIHDMPPVLDFRRAVARERGHIRLIAEIKKASPSKGLIRPNFNHKSIAAVYKEEKVDAISVLTEEDFFQGSLVFLSEVKDIAELPVLRKDFIIDEYQIFEARATRADALLLIAALLEKGQAREYLHMAYELDMAALFEVHNRDELDMALTIQAPIIGINNRDLRTLQVELNTTLILKQEIPADRIVVSESGIRTREDVIRLEDAGIDAMLIGTSLMESFDIGGKIQELRETK